MATMRKTITLTTQQDAWIKSRIADGDYTNDSEFIRDLLRRDQERAQKMANMNALWEEGIESGICDQSQEEILEDARKFAKNQNAAWNSSLANPQEMI